MSFENKEENLEAVGVLAVGGIGLLAIIIALCLVPMAHAWEERLAECAALGIPASQCPDDNSVLVPPAAAHTGSHGGSYGTYTKHLWVIEKYFNVGRALCYRAHARLVIDHRTWRENIEQPNILLRTCPTPGTKLINTVYE